MSFAFCSPMCYKNHQAPMAESIPCRKVHRFRMEPTEMEALELERTRIRCPVHLQLGPGALSAVLPAARQKQALGGAIGRAHPAQADGIVALRLRFADAATSAGRSPARLSQFLRAPG